MTPPKFTKSTRWEVTVQFELRISDMQTFREETEFVTVSEAVAERIRDDLEMAIVDGMEIVPGKDGRPAVTTIVGVKTQQPRRTTR